VVVVMVCGLLRMRRTRETVRRAVATKNVTITLSLIGVDAVAGQDDAEVVGAEFGGDTGLAFTVEEEGESGDLLFGRPTLLVAHGPDS